MMTAEVPLEWTEAGAWTTSSVTNRWRAIMMTAEAPLDRTEAGAWITSSVTRRWRTITRTGGHTEAGPWPAGEIREEEEEMEEGKKKRGTFCHFSENFFDFCHQEV